MEHYWTTTVGESPEGWFTFPKLYSEFVETMKDGSVFVEVGSWKGKSTAFLGVEIINSGKNIKCYAIDTWEGSPEHSDDPYIKTNRLYPLFVTNTQKVSSVVAPIRKTSVEGAKEFKDNSVDIVFIDACHSYECVKEDIEAWLPKIKKGGIMAGHDYYWGDNGVKKAVDERFGDRVKFRGLVKYKTDKVTAEMYENCWTVDI
jgi:hypothetical protein